MELHTRFFLSSAFNLLQVTFAPSHYLQGKKSHNLLIKEFFNLLDLHFFRRGRSRREDIAHDRGIFRTYPNN